MVDFREARPALLPDPPPRPLRSRLVPSRNKKSRGYCWPSRPGLCPLQRLARCITSSRLPAVLKGTRKKATASGLMQTSEVGRLPKASSSSKSSETLLRGSQSGSPTRDFVHFKIAQFGSHSACINIAILRRSRFSRDQFVGVES